jgi:AcrR family transcriptional regulator
MSPRPDVSQARKKQIIDAAVNVFSREGFHQARMEDIAQEAGLSKGALYWYFNSKDKIISSLMAMFLDREFSKVEEYVNEEGSARKILQKMTDMIIDDLMSIKPFMSILLEFWAMSFRNKSVGKIFRESMHRYIDLVVPVVQRGINEGEFRELDAEDVAMAFGAMIEGSILLWSYEINNVDFQTMISNSVTIFLNGIENPSHTRP